MKTTTKKGTVDNSLSILALLFLVLVTLGCEEYKYVDLTEDFNREIDTSLKDKKIVLQVDTIEIRYTKDPTEVEPQVYHEHLNFGLKVTATNNTEDSIGLYFQHSQWGVFALVPNTNDTLKFTSGSSPSKLVILPGQSVDLSLGNKLYYFHGLFPKKEDYSMEMLKLIEQLNLVYKDSIRTLPIQFSENIKVFSVNRKSQFW